MKRPFIWIGFLGIAVIAVSLVIGSFFPKKAGTLPAGFRTPILAFEFLQTKEEAYALFGAADSPERQALVKAMDRGNTWDYLYMLVYSSFLAALALRIWKLSGNRLYYLAAVLALAVLAGDFFENRQLFIISGSLASGEFASSFRLLQVFTWLKWGGLALFFLAVVPYFYRGGIFSRIIAACAVINFLAAAAAFFHRSWINEVMFMTLAIMFVLAIVYCFVYRGSEPAGK